MKIRRCHSRSLDLSDEKNEKILMIDFNEDLQQKYIIFAV
jgi:hypothetical protein